MSSSWLALSTTLCTPSVSIADDPVIAAATNLEIAMPRFATSAISRVRLFSACALKRAPLHAGRRPADEESLYRGEALNAKPLISVRRLPARQASDAAETIAHGRCGEAPRPPLVRRLDPLRDLRVPSG